MAAPKNPAGSKSDKHWREALRVALFRKDKDGNRALDLIAQRVVIMAIQGDMGAIREVGDRLDGRPTVEITATVKRGIHEFSDEELAIIAAAADQQMTPVPENSEDGESSSSIH